jgi:hypothetical protein
MVFQQKHYWGTKNETRFLGLPPCFVVPHTCGVIIIYHVIRKYGRSLNKDLKRSEIGRVGYMWTCLLLGKA